MPVIRVDPDFDLTKEGWGIASTTRNIHWWIMPDKDSVKFRMPLCGTRHSTKYKSVFQVDYEMKPGTRGPKRDPNPPKCHECLRRVERILSDGNKH